MNIPEYELDNLLSYDGRRHFLASGYFLKFEIKLVEKSERVPHGISYSFTLHDPSGKRLLGFDNAHPVAHRGSSFMSSPKASDHWHRTADDGGRPYQFVSAWKLLDDFFDEVERVLSEQGIAYDVVSDSEDEK